MTTLTPTVDETLAMARRLPLRERARMIALIAQDIAADPVATAEPWAALFATMDQIAASPLSSGRSATAEATESRR